MSYLYLLLSVACSLLLVHLLKRGESRQQRMLHTFTVNYLIAAIFAFVMDGVPTSVFNSNILSNPVFLFAAVTGIVFITNFLFYSKSIHLNGMGVSVTAMRLSLLVPVFISVSFYQEALTLLKVLGLLLVLAALGLMIPKRETILFKKMDAAWLLVIIFLLTGLADASLKIYEEDFSVELTELQFMGMVFAFACLAGLMMSVAREGPVVRRDELLTGVMIGIPNLYSAVFLIYALKGIDGSVAYPVVNILNVIGGTLLGLWLWNDKVTRLQWWGIGVALLAILLLF